MWPKHFDYVRASSVDEALEQLGNDDSKFLAGGHSLLPAMKLRLSEPGRLVDIGRIPELKGITADGALRIGAATTHTEVASSPVVQRMCPALAATASVIGDLQVRNFGTLGGNVAHADPASDPPTVLVACDAVIHIRGADGDRSVKAEAFFIDLFTTDLMPYELITHIEIPDHSAHRSAYAKFAHPASRYAVVGVAVVLQMDGDTCSSVRVAVGGAVPSARLSLGAADALVGTTLDDAALSAAAQALQADIEDDLMGDMTFPDRYRQAMAGVYLKRAVRSARG
jgi:carbon-monoxide dehydrogenase medium subunit